MLFSTILQRFVTPAADSVGRTRETRPSRGDVSVAGARTLRTHPECVQGGVLKPESKPHRFAGEARQVLRLPFQVTAARALSARTGTHRADVKGSIVRPSWSSTSTRKSPDRASAFRDAEKCSLPRENFPGSSAPGRKGETAKSGSVPDRRETLRQELQLMGGTVQPTAFDDSGRPDAFLRRGAVGRRLSPGAP